MAGMNSNEHPVYKNTKLDRRVIAEVQHRLTLAEVENLFLYNAQMLEYVPRIIPPTRALLYTMQQMLWLYGCSCLDVDPESDPEQMEWAKKAASRVWNSRLVNFPQRRGSMI